MNGRGLNGRANSSRGARKRAGAPKRRNGVTKAQQDARRKIVAESGLNISSAEVEAVLNTLRR